MIKKADFLSSFKATPCKQEATKRRSIARRLPCNASLWLGLRFADCKNTRKLCRTL